jgi:hypothetical protein
VAARAVKSLLRQVFAKVDDGVVQGAPAARALAARTVVVDGLFVRRDSPEICRISIVVKTGCVPRMNSFPQSLQCSRLLLPCSSDILS